MDKCKYRLVSKNKIMVVYRDQEGLLHLPEQIAKKYGFIFNENCFTEEELELVFEDTLILEEVLYG